MVGEPDETVIKELCLVRFYEKAEFEMLLKSPKLKWRENDHGS